MDWPGIAPLPRFCRCTRTACAEGLPTPAIFARFFLARRYRRRLPHHRVCTRYLHQYVTALKPDPPTHDPHTMLPCVSYQYHLWIAVVIDSSFHRSITGSLSPPPAVFINMYYVSTIVYASLPFACTTNLENTCHTAVITSVSLDQTCLLVTSNPRYRWVAAGEDSARRKIRFNGSSSLTGCRSCFF